MKLRLSKHLLVGVAVVALAVVLVLPVSAAGFTRGIVINVDGADYYLAGPPDAPNGAQDVPGHYWVQAGPDKIVGKHYNTGPFGAPQWWSSDAPDGEFLFKVDGIIDTWTAEKAEEYAARGYVHRHPLVSVENGTPHGSKVVWFKHTARTSFTLDGGPHPPALGIPITPGVALNFFPNYLVDPYPTP
jgi:selenium-binding protein 1